MIASPARVRRAVDDQVFLDDADAEAGQVIIVAFVHARHFRRLAADQRAAGLQAAFDDALDHALGDVDVELAGGVIIQKEQRFGSLHDDVVDAHRHEIDADGVVAAGLDCKSQLGADAVGARDHDRLAVPVERHLDQRAEAADAAEHLAAHGALDRGLDAVDERVARFDVDAGVAIGRAAGRALGHCSAAPGGEAPVVTRGCGILHTGRRPRLPSTSRWPTAPTS